MAIGGDRGRSDFGSKDAVHKVDEQYENPLVTRYASREMSAKFSPERKFRTWRQLWIALAEAEKALGLPIRQEQIEELKAHRDDLNLDAARERERRERGVPLGKVSCPLF